MLLLNVPTIFQCGDRVRVCDTTSLEERLGTVLIKEMAPVNAALARGDKTDHIYVQMDDVNVYSKWLLRGSNIIVGCHKYIVETLFRDKHDILFELDVYPYSLHELRPICQRISLANVDAMLIWLVGYDMKLINHV